MKKNEAFWINRLTTPEAVKYGRLGIVIANAQAERRRIRDRAYQEARRRSLSPSKGSPHDAA